VRVALSMPGWGSSTYRYTLDPTEYYLTPPARRGLRFSREEYKHILLACGALIAAFTISFVSPVFGGPLPPTPAIARILIGATVAVLTGFLLHELAHKVVAVRYGCWAEFRSDLRGLLMGLVTAVMGFVFAAPGAVFIAGAVTPARNGKISLAGPLTNFVVGVAAFAGARAVEAQLPLVGSLTEVILLVLVQMAYVNLLLGIFNMIPLHPLDGSKVWAWNKGAYIATMATLVAAFIVAFYLRR